jgi:hypothetical protein
MRRRKREREKNVNLIIYDALDQFNKPLAVLEMSDE